MKNLIILIAAISVACSPAFSQEASTNNAKIEKLFISMNIDKQMDTMFGQIKTMRRV